MHTQQRWFKPRKHTALLLAASLCCSLAGAAPDVDQVEQSIVRVVIGGHGTGWVVSPGVIATNWHVAEGNREFAIFPAGGNQEYRGTLRWIGDSNLDIALIDVPNLPLDPFTIHTGDARRGSDAYTIGFPGLGDDLTGRANTSVSVYGGTIALNVENAAGVKIIQHTNIVNAGNSGGPLMDECGRVLGLTTWGVENQQYQADFIWASVHVSELARQMDRLGIPYNDDPSPCEAAAGGTTIIERITEQVENPEGLENLTRQMYIWGGSLGTLLAITMALALRRPRQQIIHAFEQASKRIRNFNPQDYSDRPLTTRSGGLVVSSNSGPRPLHLALTNEALKKEAHGISLGRSAELVDYCLADDSISRRHLRFSMKNKHWYVEDLNSTNGTFLNGQQLQAYQKAEIKAGDSIKAGALQFTVSAG